MHLNLTASQNSSPLPNSVKIGCKPLSSWNLRGKLHCSNYSAVLGDSAYWPPCWPSRHEILYAVKLENCPFGGVTGEEWIGVGEIIVLRFTFAGLMYQRTSICKFYFDSKPVCDRENQTTCVDFLKEEVMSSNQTGLKANMKVEGQLPTNITRGAPARRSRDRWGAWLPLKLSLLPRHINWNSHLSHL